MSVVEQQLTFGLWHCFGVRDELVDLGLALAMLDASRTSLLPINTNQGRLLVGHGDVHPSDVLAERDLTPCLNINLQTTAAAAIETAVWAAGESGIRLLKLEVLSPLDESRSFDEACLVAACRLEADGFTVMPLLSDDVWMADRFLARTDPPCLRVMGSPIGSGFGIIHPDRIEAICELGVPVVLDGGIGCLDHARQALELGCAGFLVNSCLFKAADPAVELAGYRELVA